jgi:PAS domain S-box-containing protein
VEGLSEALALFSESTNRLEQSYRNLQVRVAEIDRELARKNEELEEANLSLRAKIEELDRTRRYLDSVIESMANGLVSVTIDGRILTVNGAAERILEHSREEMTGKAVEEWLGKEFLQSFRLCLEKGKHFEEVEGHLSANGGRRVPVRGSVSPIESRSGERLGALFIFEDLTRIHLLEEKIRRSDRLTALGELAAGVAHEMRNPLTTIRGFVQILPRQADKPGFLEKMTMNVLREIDRLSLLTQDLLDFAKPVGTDLSLENAARLVRDVIGFHLDSRPGQSLLTDEGPMDEHVMVRVDRNRIKQVLLNVVVNALESVNGHGVIHYETSVASASLR